MSELRIGGDAYRVDRFPLPSASDTNPAPLDLALAGGRVWLCCEFDRRIYSLVTGATVGATMTAHDIPAPSVPIYRSTLFGQDKAVAISASERIAVAADGAVWVSQGGQLTYGGLETNLSRVLRYEPGSNTWRAYTLPWNNAAAAGFLVEEPQGRLWVALASPKAGNALACTRYGTWLPSDTVPTESVSGLLASLSRDVYRGWRLYPLVQHGRWPAHVMKHGDGRLYVSLYWGNAIMALWPDSGIDATLQIYPLPPPGPGAVLGSSGPWQMLSDGGGGIWFSQNYVRRLGHLNPADGKVTQYDLASLTAVEHPHSLARDPVTGFLWWTAYTSKPAPDNAGRIGRVTSGAVIEYSEPLTKIGIHGGATGVAVEDNGTVWCACFLDKAVIRLSQ